LTTEKTQKKYQRTSRQSPTAEAIDRLGENLSERLDEITNIAEAFKEGLSNLEERLETLEKLEKTLEGLEEKLEGKLEDLDGWDPGGFAADLDEIHDLLKEPIIRACLRGAA
jgi:chromosome segregation ATPase